MNCTMWSVVQMQDHFGVATFVIIGTCQQLYFKLGYACLEDLPLCCMLELVMFLYSFLLNFIVRHTRNTKCLGHTKLISCFWSYKSLKND